VDLMLGPSELTDAADSLAAAQSGTRFYPVNLGASTNGVGHVSVVGCSLERGQLPAHMARPSVAWLRDVPILFDQHPELLMEDAGQHAAARRERLTPRKR